MASPIKTLMGYYKSPLFLRQLEINVFGRIARFREVKFVKLTKLFYRKVVIRETPRVLVPLWVLCNLIHYAHDKPFLASPHPGGCRFATRARFPGAGRHRPQYPTNVWGFD